MLAEIAKRQIQAMRDSLDVYEATVEDFPELTGVNALSFHSGGSIGAAAPYNHALFEENRDRLEKAGWIFRSSRQWTDDGVYGEFYYKGGVDFSIFYRPTMTGSTCKLNILGYEQTPIYEVTCMDAEPLVPEVAA